jgi:GntR family transcriptional regulator
VPILKQNGIPLYVQLEEIFTGRIESGEWPVGQLIPNELQLCDEFQVSRGPVRQALDQIVRNGMLHRKQGRGTVVLPAKTDSRPADFFSFTTLIERNGQRPGMRLLTLEVVAAGATAGRPLHLAPDEAVFQIRRLRLADEEPLILESVYLPQAICPGLTADEVASASLYQTLRERYGVGLVSSTQYLEPSVANDFEAEVLGIERRAPVLLLTNIAYASRQRPVVFSKAIMRGDRVRYYVELTAPFGST